VCTAWCSDSVIRILLTLVSWVLTPCGVAGRHQRVAGTYCVHFQWRWRWRQCIYWFHIILVININYFSNKLTFLWKCIFNIIYIHFEPQSDTKSSMSSVHRHAAGCLFLLRLLPRHARLLNPLPRKENPYCWLRNCSVPLTSASSKLNCALRDPSLSPVSVFTFPFASLSWWPSSCKLCSWLQEYDRNVHCQL
jgi:hypothetical protein